MDGSGTVSWGIAFLAGVLSFLSPCVAPIVPGYLSFISGSAIGAADEDSRRTERVMIASALFILGFSTVFVVLGAAAGLLGGLLEGYRTVVSRASGVVMVAMGLFVLGLVRMPALYRERRVHFIDRPYGPLGTVLLGAAFGFGWTPCIGPVLASILLYAAAAETAREGALLLLVYSLGLGVPFVLAALALSHAAGALSWLKRSFHVVNAVSGVLLITMGALFVTDQAAYLTYLNVAALRLVELAMR